MCPHEPMEPEDSPRESGVFTPLPADPRSRTISRRRTLRRRTQPGGVPRLKISDYGVLSGAEDPSIFTPHGKFQRIAGMSKLTIRGKSENCVGDCRLLPPDIVNKMKDPEPTPPAYRRWVPNRVNKGIDASLRSSRRNCSWILNPWMFGFICLLGFGTLALLLIEGQPWDAAAYQEGEGWADKGFHHLGPKLVDAHARAYANIIDLGLRTATGAFSVLGFLLAVLLIYNFQKKSPITYGKVDIIKAAKRTAPSLAFYIKQDDRGQFYVRMKGDFYLLVPEQWDAVERLLKRSRMEPARALVTGRASTEDPRYAALQAEVELLRQQVATLLPEDSFGEERASIEETRREALQVELEAELGQIAQEMKGLVADRQFGDEERINNPLAEVADLLRGDDGEIFLSQRRLGKVAKELLKAMPVLRQARVMTARDTRPLTMACQGLTSARYVPGSALKGSAAYAGTPAAKAEATKSDEVSGELLKKAKVLADTMAALVGKFPDQEERIKDKCRKAHAELHAVSQAECFQKPEFTELFKGVVRSLYTLQGVQDEDDDEEGSSLSPASVSGFATDLLALVNQLEQASIMTGGQAGPIKELCARILAAASSPEEDYDPQLLLDSAREVMESVRDLTGSVKDLMEICVNHINVEFDTYDPEAASRLKEASDAAFAALAKIAAMGRGIFSSNPASTGAEGETEPLVELRVDGGDEGSKREETGYGTFGPS